MNTRLQVEHPVTELGPTGLDLVELQLRVAAGEPLPIGQDDVTVTGHAIEARVYAEDSFGDFLPQAGPASIVRGLDSRSVRVDHALESGQVVSTSYDPMLGKVIAHGPDRETARRALVAALDDTVVLGLTTNVGFLRALADQRRVPRRHHRHRLARPRRGRGAGPGTGARIIAPGRRRAPATSEADPFQADGFGSARPAPGQSTSTSGRRRPAGGLELDETPVTGCPADTTT